MRLLVLAAVVELLLPISARSELPHEIPFRYQDGLIWLKVELAGKKERMNFLLDSGASVSAIIFAIDLGSVSECCQQHIDGILGADFFRDRIVQIDFKAGKICLLKNCKLNTANCDTLRIRMRNGAFCVPVRIAGNPVQWMRLDTGCDSALEWVVTGTEKRRMGGPSIGLSAASVHYMNVSARLGKHSFNDIAAGIHTREIFPGEDGLLGNGLLSKFCLTIDERKSRVVFENPSYSPAANH